MALCSHATAKTRGSYDCNTVLESDLKPGSRLRTTEKVAAGWREILGLLEHELETGDIPLKTKVMYGMFGTFMFMMPKTTTKEYVDKQGW